jgi:hypothetical protein
MNSSTSASGGMPGIPANRVAEASSQRFSACSL